MTRAQYDSIAAWYDACVRSESVPDHFVLSHLLEILGDVRGLYICDLACGQGRLARELARRGAHVVGIDLSPRLLAIAQGNEKAQPSGIGYVLDDAQGLHAIAGESFDGVVCHMALMDIPDLEATLQAAWRVLRSRGWFVFTITHPCFQAPHSTWVTRADGSTSREIRGYFDQVHWRSKNVAGLRGKVGAYHRTLSTYVNTTIRAGFTIEHVAEPRATGRVVDRIPGYAVVPGFLMVQCRKR
jgi:ubiquinone/menaquinone biosynthesis C-methylase UbiE